MAQPIDDRIASALKPGSRLADCETLLIDVRAEVERVQAAKEKAEDRRSDPTVSEADASEAHLDAEEAKLRLIRLARAEVAIGEAIEAKKAADKQRAMRTRYDQVRKRRDDLASELAERVAPMIDDLAAILARIAENDREIAEINRMKGLPEGCEALKGAEVVARGAFAGQYGGHKLVEMKLPLFALNGLAWPSDGDAKAAAERTRETASRIAQANAEREASRARFLISAGDCKTSFPAALTDEGKIPVRGVIDAWCYPHQVDANRKLGLHVEPWSEGAAHEVASRRKTFESALT